MIAALWGANVVVLHVLVLIALYVAALVVFVLLVLIELLLLALLALRSLHLLLVDLQQRAEEGGVLPHQVRELCLEILLLRVPLLDLCLLVAELILALLDLMHNAGLVLATLGGLLEKRFILLLQLVQGQQLLVQHQQLHVSILQVTLQLRLLLLNGGHSHVEGVNHLAHVLLQLALVMAQPRLGFHAHRLRQWVSFAGFVLEQFGSQRETAHPARCQRSAAAQRQRRMRGAEDPLLAADGVLAACLHRFAFRLLRVAFIFVFCIDFIIDFLFILLIEVILWRRWLLLHIATELGSEGLDLGLIQIEALLRVLRGSSFRIIQDARDPVGAGA
mmetsp:Transcript_67701/g.161527  ORF Transcript_67701/g.161527 Transcript_67701/m.161527 type:complete len:332 (+) Transcript_67701:1018-2013(+)